MSLPDTWEFKGYEFRVVDAFPEEAYRALVAENLGTPPQLADFLDDIDRKRHQNLAESLPRGSALKVGIWRGSELAGLTYGRHSEDSTFNMSISLVAEAHRGHGLYGELLRYVLARTKLEGYQKIVSRHRATNNAVIIPKLKAGFTISGLELDAMMGTLVRLTYFHAPDLRATMDKRAGF